MIWLQSQKLRFVATLFRLTCNQSALEASWENLRGYPHCQRRLISDREGRAPQQQEEDDVCEVVLSSLCERRPRTLGDCWLGCRLWEKLGLDTFWSQALGDRRGAVEWSKVIKVLGRQPALRSGPAS